LVEPAVALEVGKGRNITVESASEVERDVRVLSGKREDDVCALEALHEPRE
jgi:hypothetical protein